MAVRRHKSHLDRLVSANRGRNKSGGQKRKFVTNHQPPTPPSPPAAVMTDVDKPYPAEADWQDDDRTETSHPPQPVITDPPTTERHEAEFEELSPEDMLDELVEDSDDDEEPEPQIEPKLDMVPQKGSAILAISNPSFRRPPNAPLSPSVRQHQSSVGDDSVAPGQIVIQLPLPIVRKYLSQKQPQQALRSALADRLTKCVDHNANKPLYLGDSLRRKVEQFAHRDFSSAEEFVGWLLSNADVFCGSQSLDIEPYLIQRALDRKPPEQTFGEYLSELLTTGIEIKTGLR